MTEESVFQEERNGLFAEFILNEAEGLRVTAVSREKTNKAAILKKEAKRSRGV